MVVAASIMMVISLVSVCVGPVSVPPSQVLGTLLAHVPLLHFHTSTPSIDQAIVWQIRLPRVVLAGLVGAMLAAGGAAYQGVFRNPLADPYLLGVAAGAGLGATVVIVATGAIRRPFLPIVAFVGGSVAVAADLSGRVAGSGRQGVAASIVLAGVAVAALLTAIQTYLQQGMPSRPPDLQLDPRELLRGLVVRRHADPPLRGGERGGALAHRRMLDVLRVGEEEAGTLGIHAARSRLIVVAAATLGTAAAVSVSGLIGFVGIIVAHTVRSDGRVELPDRRAGLDDRRRGVPDLRRPGRAHGRGPGRGADRRRDGLHRGSVLPLRAGVAVAAASGSRTLMARLGTVIRLAERRGRRGVGSHVDGAMVELGAVTVRFDGGSSSMQSRRRWAGGSGSG